MTALVPLAGTDRRRWRIPAPTAPNPPIIISQVAGSGTPATSEDVAVTNDDDPGLNVFTRYREAVS